MISIKTTGDIKLNKSTTYCTTNLLEELTGCKLVYRRPGKKFQAQVRRMK